MSPQRLLLHHKPSFVTKGQRCAELRSRGTQSRWPTQPGTGGPVLTECIGVLARIAGVSLWGIAGQAMGQACLKTPPRARGTQPQLGDFLATISCPFLSRSTNSLGSITLPRRIADAHRAVKWRACPVTNTHISMPGGATCSSRRRAVAGSSGSRPNCRAGTPVCAAARGPVCAAADPASRPDSPRGPLGCRAALRPPVGAATRANGRCALPSDPPPVGIEDGTGAAALCPCR